MTDELMIIKKLDRAAERVQAPIVDVTGRVMSSVRGIERRERLTWPVGLAMALACAAALVLVAYTWNYVHDPLADMVFSMRVAIR